MFDSILIPASLFVLVFSDESTPAANFYLRANEKCELFMKWMLIIGSISIITAILFPVFATALFYYVQDGRIEAKNLFLTLHTK